MKNYDCSFLIISNKENQTNNEIEEELYYYSKSRDYSNSRNSSNEDSDNMKSNGENSEFKIDNSNNQVEMIIFAKENGNFYH